MNHRSSLIVRGSGAPAFDRAMQKSGFDLRVLSMLLYTASRDKERSPSLGNATWERKISLKVCEVLGSACSVRDTCEHPNIEAEGITQFLQSSAIQNFHST